MVSQNPLSLESLIGPVSSDAVHDPFFVSGTALTWVSTLGDINALCKLLQAESERSLAGLPNREFFGMTGGFVAHLKVSMHGQGIPVGEVHAELGVRKEHIPVVYANTDIIECIGMKSGGVPDCRKPPALSSLNLGTFFSLSSRRMKVGGLDLAAVVTNGVNVAKNEHGQLTLEYEIGTHITPLPGQIGYSTAPSSLVLKVSAHAQVKALSYTLFFWLEQLNPVQYVGVLKSGRGIEISFGSDGKVRSMTSKDMQGVPFNHRPQNYGAVYYAGFDASRTIVPNINLPQTMKSMFTFASNMQTTVPSSVENLIVYA